VSDRGGGAGSATRAAPQYFEKWLEVAYFPRNHLSFAKDLTASPEYPGGAGGGKERKRRKESFCTDRIYILSLTFERWGILQEKCSHFALYILTLNTFPIFISLSNRWHFYKSRLTS
jgi:hypothetical protein